MYSHIGIRTDFIKPSCKISHVHWINVPPSFVENFKTLLHLYKCIDFFSEIDFMPPT